MLTVLPAHQRASKTLAALCGTALFLTPQLSLAEPTHIETVEPRLLCLPPAPPETCLVLPPGHFVDAATWAKLDDTIVTAEDAVTRLNAENKSLRSTLSGWSPGWLTLTTTLLVGAGVGWYVHSQI